MSGPKIHPGPHYDWLELSPGWSCCGPDISGPENDQSCSGPGRALALLHRPYKPYGSSPAEDVPNSHSRVEAAQQQIKEMDLSTHAHTSAPPGRKEVRPPRDQISAVNAVPDHERTSVINTCPRSVQGRDAGRVGIEQKHLEAVTSLHWTSVTGKVSAPWEFFCSFIE